MTVINARYRWPQPPGVTDRPDGAEEYVLLCFRQPVTLHVRGERLPARAGAFIVLSPGVPYRFACESALTYDWMHITGDLTPVLEEYGLSADTLYQPANSAKIASLIEEVEFAFYEKPYFWWRFAELKIEEMCMAVSQGLGRRAYPSQTNGTFHRLKAIRSEMMTYPERDWSVKILAYLLHISESRVYPLYRGSFGVTPNQDLIRMRVNKAKRYLLGGHTVTETAESVGYGNINHFSRQFRQMTGVSPAAFQKQATNLP